MGAAPSHLNHEKSDKDLTNDQRQKRSSSSCFEENVSQSDLSILTSIGETFFRTVVREELDRKLPEIWARPTRSSLSQTQVQEQPRLKLVFSKDLPSEIFTRYKILDEENKPLQILLVDINSNSVQVMLTPVKVQLVVLNGDFSPRDCDPWTSKQFEDNIARERDGKPLLRGDLNVTLEGGSATIGDIKFFDNSKCSRSGTFKIGARVISATNSKGLSVVEAMTNGFTVKEHRMAKYQKKRGRPMFDDSSRQKKVPSSSNKKRKMTGVLMEQQNRSHVQPNEPLNNNDGEGSVLKHVNTSKIDNNLHREIGNSHTVHQQGIMTESTLPTQVDLMERQNLSHGEGSVSIGSQDLHDIFKEDGNFPHSSQLIIIDPDFSPSQLDSFNNPFFSPSRLDPFNNPDFSCSQLDPLNNPDFSSSLLHPFNNSDFSPSQFDLFNDPGFSVDD